MHARSPLPRPPEETAFELRGPLDAAQREFLDTYGFIRFRRFATPAEVAMIHGELAAVEAAWIAEDRRLVNGIPIKYGTDGEGRRYVNRYPFSSLFSAKLHDFLTDDRFRLVTAICGPDFRIGEREKDGLVVNHFINLPGSGYTRLGWHVDSLRDLFYGRMPQPMWNVGLYLDDSRRRNGALRILPGTHRQGLGGMLFGKLHFLAHDDDPREIVLEADAGDLTLHDGRLWHRVGRAEIAGPESRRRTMYVPCINGPVEEKNEGSKTPLYHRLSNRIR